MFVMYFIRKKIEGVLCLVFYLPVLVSEIVEHRNVEADSHDCNTSVGFWMKSACAFYIHSLGSVKAGKMYLIYLIYIAFK